MLRCLLPFIAGLLCSVGTAVAMVGTTEPPDPAVARHVVLIVGSRGTFCSGVALARNLVLTAGHCVLPGAEYKLVEYDAAHQPAFRDVATIARHPEFDVNAVLRHRATADVALLKLAAPLSAALVPASLAAPHPIAAGDALVVAGYGVAIRGDGRSGGTVRSATLVATGQPGTLQIRLADPAGKGARAGAGACTGDSGAPVFVNQGGEFAVAGLVSWSTGPNMSDGCGGLTGVTPLVRYREWITAAARQLGSPLAP
jgi:secreted trypsin-like serine protease